MRTKSKIIPVLLLLTIIGGSAEAADSKATSREIYPEKHLGEFYDRLAKDLEEGKPLVVTVYVALCDNASQGIIPTKNPNICMGDYPKQNLYWSTSGGLKKHLGKQRWKRIHHSRSKVDKIAVKGVWKKRIYAGKELRKRGIRGSIPVYIVGLAYRGVRIHDAMVDYLRAVSTDRADSIDLKDGTQLHYGGASHIVGYIGHDYFMDVKDPTTLRKEANGLGTKHKGVFGLACVSDVFFRPSIQRRNTHLFALNKGLTFPSAFTALGIVRGVAAGKSMRGIHREAARAFAKGQGHSLKTMLRALAYGDKEIR